MASTGQGFQDICSTCDAPLSPTLRHCPTCTADAGAPNVRACLSDDNRKALAARFADAESRTSAKGCSKELCTLSDLVEKQSGVVVCMSAGMARSLFEDPNILYANYERLVGANARKPKVPDNDRHRCAVGGSLFGSYANYIFYGALSLTEKGLPTYGAVHCRLRSVTIDKRTSFLETNSYRFVREHSIIPGDKIPAGYTASWEDRHLLVLAKMADRLSTGQTESDWQAILIHSDGQNKENDDFVEAHIYESFDRNAIECLVEATGKKLSRSERLDLDLAMNEFKRLWGKTK